MVNEFAAEEFSAYHAMMLRYYKKGLTICEFREQDAITEYQAGNLEKRADYLMALPMDYEKFTMSYLMFYLGDMNASDLVVEMPECGAVACALGHAPMAGVPYVKNEYWMQMGQRELGLCLEAVEPHSFSMGPLWDYCFTGSWHEFDNTPQGAGKRIKEFLRVAREGGFVR